MSETTKEAVMKKESNRGFKVIPANEKKCIWMESGAVTYKLCNNHYQCNTCQFDMAMANRVEKQKEQELDMTTPKKPVRVVSHWTEEFRNLPASERKCRYMLMGEVSYKVCPNSFRCGECAFDQMMQEKMSERHVLDPKDLVLESGFYIDEHYSYYRNHMWLKLERNGKYRVGLDDFAGRLLGELDHIHIPGPGRKVGAGEFFWSAQHEYGDLEFASPLEGIIDGVNYDAVIDPSLITSDPYGKGWLMLIEPENIRKATGNLFQSSEARAWMAEESKMLNTSLHDSSTATVHDGAIASDNIAKNIKKEEWRVLAKNHLHIK